MQEFLILLKVKSPETKASTHSVCGEIRLSMSMLPATFMGGSTLASRGLVFSGPSQEQHVFLTTKPIF